jgi:tetratricopeptide (TPR) repeat protein
MEVTILVSQEDIDALREKCMELSKERRNKEAIECFERVLEIASDDFLSLRQIGIILSYPKIPDEKSYLLAMEYLNRALELVPDDYKTLRQKAEVASKLREWEQAIITYKELLIRSDGRDWKCWRGKGIAHADRGEPEEAIECFERAIALNEKDVISLRKKGVALSLMGRDEEALIWFEKALAIPHRDCYNTLRDMGVSLRRIGRFEEAEKYLDAAIEKNSQNAPALREKGILLSQCKKDREAIAYFLRALKINKSDFDSWRQLAVSLLRSGKKEKSVEALLEAERILFSQNEVIADYSKLRERAYLEMSRGKHEQAEKLLDRALNINPHDALTHLVYAMLYEEKGLEEIALQEYLEFIKNANTYQETRFVETIDERMTEIWNKIQKKSFQPIERVLEAIIERIGDYKQFLETIKDNEKRFEDFLGNDRSIPEGTPSFFVVLRKWNSYTPILPSEGGDNKGGGYFLYHRGFGVVIDPGFNFIDNFYQEGFTIDDVDAVLITHAHADHTADFIPLLTLLYERNKTTKNTGKKIKKIHLLFNLGAEKKYPFLNPRDFKQVHNPIILNPEEGPHEFPPEHPIMEITPVLAEHTDIVSQTACLGYFIDLGIAKIGLTGDTAWKVDARPGYDIEDSVPKIAEFFRNLNPDIMVVHLGSIHSEEFSYTEKTEAEQKIKCFDKNHLGILGASLFLNAVRPKIAIISEFGAELRECRQAVVEGLKEGLSLPCCLAGDIGLYVQLHNKTVLTTYPTYRFIPYTNIASTLPERGSQICYHEKGVEIKGLSPDDLDSLNERLEQKKEPLNKRTYY